MRQRFCYKMVIYGHKFVQIIVIIILNDNLVTAQKKIERDNSCSNWFM